MSEDKVYLGDKQLVNGMNNEDSFIIITDLGIKRLTKNQIINDLKTILEVDNTLTESGKAADAKVVGDRLDELSEKIVALEDNGAGSGANIAQAKSLLAIVQKTALLEQLTEAELTAFKTAWGITTENIPATGISIDKSTLSFTDSSNQTLIATVEPSNSTDSVTWRSSNTSIATVSNGIVTPVANGSCAITASAGNYSATCSITVNISQTVTTYTVTKNLTNCSGSNSATSVTSGSSYINKITASSGYTLTGATVSVTMGGADITSSAYNNGAINISNVTGNIVIAVSAVASTSSDGWRTASQIVNDITVGWNYANALDATQSTVRSSALNHTSEEGTDYENSWGNPLASQEMMNAVADKGFNAVRIPVTWNHHLIDDGNGNITISSPFLNRVKAVVDMAINAGMMVFLNSHHDTANYSNGKTMESAGNTGLTWEMKVPYQLFTTDSSSPTNATMCTYIKKLWTQIANAFKDYDDRLIFEGFNEILDSGRNWNEPNEEQVTNVNNLNNAFIQAVRATGGNNAKRVLSCQTYGGYEKGLAVTGFSVSDTEEDKIILQAHLYTDAKKGALENKLAPLAAMSYPVIIGEFAWGLNTVVNGDTQYYFAQNYVAIARSLGMKCFWWDSNNFDASTGKFGLLNRSSLTWERPQTVQGLIDGVTQEALDEVVDAKPYENGTILTDQEASYGAEGDVAVTGHNCITIATDVTGKSSVTANVTSADGVKVVRSAFYENGTFISGTRVGYWGSPQSSVTASVPTGATQFKITITMPSNGDYDVISSYENGITTVDFTTSSNSGSSGSSGGSVSDSEDYELVFEDDFSNGIDTTKWNIRDEILYQYRGRKTLNKTENVEIVNDSDGTHLQLTGKLVGTSDPAVDGASMDTAYKHVFGYGKMEARIKIPNKNAVGSCFAFWTCGFNAGIVEDIEGENYPLGCTWAETGEIDITEIENSISTNHKNNYSHSTLHFYDYTTHKDNSVVDMTGASLEMDTGDTNWHTYTMEWDELELKIYLDGVLKHTVDIGSTDQLRTKFKAFHEFEQYIILGIGAYGLDSPSTDNPDYTGWPITALVDYVKVWQKTGQTYNTTLDNYTVLPKVINVVSQPNKTEYTRGSAFDPTGLTCKIKYSDDSSHTSIVDSSQLTYAWNSYYAGDINNMQGNAISGGSNYEGYVIVRYEEEGVRVETNVHVTLTA